MRNNYKPLAPLAGYLCFLLKAFVVVQVLSLADDVWTHYSLKSTLAELKSISNTDGKTEAPALPPSREDGELQARELVSDTATPASTDSLPKPGSDEMKQLEEDSDRRKRELDALIVESQKAIDEADRVLLEAKRSAYWQLFEAFFSFSLSVAYFLLYVLTGILFLKWVYRAYRNLRAFSDAQMKRTPEWAAWSYFIPIASLFVPPASMEEIWAASHKSGSGGLTALWWLLVIVSNVLVRAWLNSFAGAMKNANPIEAFASDRFFLQSLAADLLQLGVTALTLVLVARITAAYKQNIVENLGEAPSEVATSS
jgi:hypothetical protein